MAEAVGVRPESFLYITRLTYVLTAGHGSLQNKKSGHAEHKTPGFLRIPRRIQASFVLLKNFFGGWGKKVVQSGGKWNEILYVCLGEKDNHYV